MTIRNRRLFVAGAVGVLAVATPAIVGAVHPFGDVPDGQWYSEPVDWAFENGITTGTSETTFSGDQTVTRYQNITFTHRYDQAIVQPAFAELEARLAAIEASTDHSLLEDRLGKLEVAQLELDDAQAGLETDVAANADDITELDRQRASATSTTDDTIVTDWNGSTRDVTTAFFARTDGMLVVDYIVHVSVDDSETAVGNAIVSAGVTLNSGDIGAEATVIDFDTTEQELNARTLHVREIVEVEAGAVTLTGEVGGFFGIGGQGVLFSQALSAVFVPGELTGF